MQPASSMIRGVRSSAGVGACSARTAPLRAAFVRVGRKPCKPVAFKENNPDNIDAPSTPPTRPTTAAAGASPPLGPDPLMSGTANLRPVNLGPVATVMYPALKYGTAVAAAAAIVAPGAVGALLFNGAVLSATDKLLVLGAGAALIPSVTAKRQIKLAADKHNLADPVQKQLVSACLLHGVLGLVVLSQAVSLRNPILAATVGGLSGLTTITTAYTLVKVRESGQLMPSMSGLLGGLMDLLAPSNLPAAAYSVLTATMLAMGVMLFTSDPTAPCALFFAAKDSVHVFATRITGSAMMANAIMLFTIKQAADHGRQKSHEFRNLNAGLALYAGIGAVALLYGLASGIVMPVGATYGYIGFMALTGLVTGYYWATGSK